MYMKIKVVPKKRNPLVAPVMKKAVKRHKDRKREAKGKHSE